MGKARRARVPLGLRPRQNRRRSIRPASAARRSNLGNPPGTSPGRKATSGRKNTRSGSKIATNPVFRAWGKQPATFPGGLPNVRRAACHGASLTMSQQMPPPPPPPPARERARGAHPGARLTVQCDIAPRTTDHSRARWLRQTQEAQYMMQCLTL